MRIAVVGAGSWGSALGVILAGSGHDVRLLARDAATASGLQNDRVNTQYLPGCPFPDTLSCGVVGESCSSAELTVAAVPSGALADTLPSLEGSQRIVVVSKGLDASGRVLSELVTEAYPSTPIAALSGPNLAAELARGIPTAAVAASTCEDTAALVRRAFASKSFRIYITDDIRGVELAGALKNVISLGAGISDGLGFGNNTKGALLSRGLSEIARLGLAMGARLETFLGVAGVGDLFATAASTLSRNYRVGRAVGEGKTVEQALAEIGQVAEGVPTSKTAAFLAEKHGVETVIMNAIHLVISGKKTPLDGVSTLMDRSNPYEGLGYVFDR
jgi:glycerol-3-phosphate dehydrogenase (NAD(P)+)